MHPVLLSIFVLLFLSGCASPKVVRKRPTPLRKEVAGKGEYRWEAKAGWVQPQRGSWGLPDQVRSEAREAFDAGAYADALEGLKVYKSSIAPSDPSYPETVFLMAECYYRLGDYEQAVDLYKEIYRKLKPAGDLMSRSFLRVHDMAMDYIHGNAACYFLGFSYNCPSEGIELLVGEEGLITEYPRLSFADDAVMEIAKHYFDRMEYPEAVPLYERLIREYPESEWRSPAEYQLALSIFKQIRGIDYDEKILADAERKFRQYVENNPRGPQTEDARGKQKEIREMLGEKNLRLAKFYLRESEPAAAQVYLRLVLERYTSSTAAREAREIQRQLEKY